MGPMGFKRSQDLGESGVRGVGNSGSWELKESKAQGVMSSRSQELRSQKLKESGAREVGNSGSRELRKSRRQELEIGVDITPSRMFPEEDMSRG